MDDSRTLLSVKRTGIHTHPCRRLLLLLISLLAFVPGVPMYAASIRASFDDTTAGPTFSPQSFSTNLGDYPNGQVPSYARFELAFDIAATTASNPYFPYDADPPPGVEPAVGITVDALLLPPGEMNWANARTLPCFYYQPVEDVGSGEMLALLPVGAADWRCRFAPDIVGTWRYKVRATDAGGTTESAEAQFDCIPSTNKGFVWVSGTDARFFELADGTPFVTPLINPGYGGPFNTLANIRDFIPQLGASGIRFVRWFPTGEGANYFAAPFGDTIKINWHFGANRLTASYADTASGKWFSYVPYYYSSQRVTILRGTRYRLSFRANVTSEHVLRAELGDLSGGHIDVCSASGTYHASVGETCDYAQDGWHDYEVIVTVPGSGATVLDVGLRGLYGVAEGPPPFDVELDGWLRVHSIQLQRDETGSDGWGANLLTRSDPDTFTYVDQLAAARLDEVLRLSEQHGVYHKLPLFHKNGVLLARFLADGTLGDWDVNHFYAEDDVAARWYELAYVRYFVGRWSHSTALHSLELANENNFDAPAQDASFAIAEAVHALSPRHILMSNSFWGWWVESFWTDPTRGHLMDYSDKHWYANETGSYCNDDGERCELISNVWDDSAAYVRECGRRFDEYREAYSYSKPIVRGEGGVGMASTEPQHPDIAQEAEGIYYHKKIWAHVGILGDTCDGEWYPRLSEMDDGGAFPNDDHDLFKMFARYTEFVDGEPLSNGHYVEIGTDLTGAQQIGVTGETGAVRAWGVQDILSRKTLLWIDNAAHTWKATVDGTPVTPASGTVIVAGFQPEQEYVVQWWDPYAVAGTAPDVTVALTGADGTLALSISGLTHDVAVKVLSHQHRYYLPLIIKSTSGWSAM